MYKQTNDTFISSAKPYHYGLALLFILLIGCAPVKVQVIHVPVYDACEPIDPDSFRTEFEEKQLMNGHSHDSLPTACL